MKNQENGTHFPWERKLTVVNVDSDESDVGILEKDFKAVIIIQLKKVKENMLVMNKKVGNTSREIEYTAKMENIELKNIISEI